METWYEVEINLIATQVWVWDRLSAEGNRWFPIVGLDDKPYQWSTHEQAQWWIEQGRFALSKARIVKVEGEMVEKRKVV